MHYLSILVLFFLASCMTYVEKPLPTTPQFVDVPQKELTVSDLIEIAIVNNMELRLQKRDLSISEAEVYSARLFDDLTFGLDLTRSTEAGDSMIGSDWTLSYDLQTLITKADTIDAAEFERQKNLYSVIWAEWQLAWNIRLLYAKHVYLTQQAQFLREQTSHLDHFYQSLAKALSKKTKKVSDVSTALISFKDSQKSLNDLELQIEQNLQELKKAACFSPDAMLKINIGSLPPPPAIKDADVDAALQHILERRPDLLALKAGYESQDKKLRIELLKQFPSFSVYVTRSKDTDASHSTGFGFEFNLPIFNVNRGNIMIESANRDKAHLEYQSKLNEVTTSVRNAQKNAKLLSGQVQKLQAQVKHLNGSLSLAERSHQDKLIAKENLHEIRNSTLTARQELVEAQHALYEMLIGLQIELGFVVTQEKEKA